MSKLKLTQTIVDNIEAKTNDCVYWDSMIAGFGLKVTKAGHRSFILQTRIDGRQFKKTLFKADRVKLEAARKEAQMLLGKIAFGNNPFDQTVSDIKTLTAFSEIYIEEHAKKHKKPRSVTDDQSLLRNHILPWLGHFHPEKITRQQVKLFMEAVADGRTAQRAKSKGICKDTRLKGGKICANRCWSVLSKMFNFGIEEDYLKRADNPAQKIRKNKENTRDYFLNTEQLQALRSAIRKMRRARRSDRKALYVIELILLTGARRNEINRLLWEEVDMENKVIRKVDTKTGKRDIPLSDRSYEILLKLQKRTTRSSGFVFANGQLTPISIRKPWARVREAAGLPPEITLHTLRHTFASHAAMSGKNAFQIGKILGHKSMETTKRYVKIGNDTARDDVNDVVNGMFG